MEDLNLVSSSIISSNKRRRTDVGKREDGAARDDPEKEEEEDGSEGSMELISGDTLQWSIMSRLDAQSLARCLLVCKLWNRLASSELLWRPLLVGALIHRAQLPLRMVSLSHPIASRDAYGLVMTDSTKYRLVSSDMCGRTWELSVKPTCGPYWQSLDPSTRGQPGLVRFFHCDGSLTAAANDPIWGGQESAWKFVLAGREQHIKINYWPKFEIVRLDDGRWRLQNEWASYTTIPDLYLGTGTAICKEKAPPCSGCSYPRLRNAVTALVQR